MYPKQRNQSSGWMFAALAGLGFALLGLPDEAKAGDNWSFSVNLGHHSRPAYATVVRTVRVRPAYEHRTRKVWVPAEYADRIVTVEIAPVLRTREVPIYDSYGNVTGYREVAEVIEPARVVERVERVLVRDGYYRTVRERVLVRRSYGGVGYDRVRVSHRSGRDGLQIGFRYGRDRDHRYGYDRRHNVRRLVRHAFRHARY